VTIFRPAPQTQRDGSEFANANCRMVGIAVGIEYHTSGAIVSTGAEMRTRQDDQVGGTDSGDSAQAWRTYGQDLRIMDGHTFDDALADLRDGRNIQLDVWHATTGGPCLSGSGAYGHDLNVNPEQNGTKWLVCDPWCSPAKWTWWEESLLRAGAEKLGSQAYTAAVSGPGRPRTERELVRLMVQALRALFTRYTPDRPARFDPPDIGGSGGRIFYTTTKSQLAPVPKVDDMAINAAADLVTGFRADVPAGLLFYSDANLSDQLGKMSRDASVVYVGQPIGESVEGGARAIMVNTGNAYNDGSVRPTIVYVHADAIDPVKVPPGPDDGDVDAAVAARDEEWRAWLLDGAPDQEADPTP
jgi:hypothetical protein